MELMNGYSSPHHGTAVQQRLASTQLKHLIALFLILSLLNAFMLCHLSVKYTLGAYTYVAPPYATLDRDDILSLNKIKKSL
jgi:hypothetical protein